MSSLFEIIAAVAEFYADFLFTVPIEDNSITVDDKKGENRGPDEQ